jgi:hypothetical protein
MAKNPNIPNVNNEGFIQARLKRVANIAGDLVFGLVGITAAAFAFTETLISYDDNLSEPFNGPDFE